MRRKDREITDMNDIIAIIRKCDCCDLALFDEEYPYVVPLNFGFRFADGRLRLFFHGADAGTKMALIGKDPRASFAMHTAHRYVPSGGAQACKATMEYESVCGSGIVRIVPDAEKAAALTDLMRQYERRETFAFDAEMMSAVAVLELSAERVTGKRLRK